MRFLSQFLAAASDPAHFPAPTLPEVAFLGRSNVGKSSVINALVGSKIARTSSTPGRTRAINFFGIRRAGEANNELILADLPGYGYAKLSREESSTWAGFVDPYLAERPTLVLCIALVDANVPPQASDARLIEFLQTAGRPFLIVATKTDRLSGNKLPTALRQMSQTYHGARVIPFSAHTGAGRDALWREVLQALPAAQSKA